MSDTGFATLIIFVIFCGCLGCYFGGVGTERELAVEANVAHYEIDPKTGEETFVYDCPNCDK